MTTVTSVEVVSREMCTQVDKHPCCRFDDCRSTTIIPIESDLVQNIDSIDIEPYHDDDKNVPKTMFTIIPSEDGNGVTAEIEPANLVKLIMDDKNKRIVVKWNIDVVNAAGVVCTHGDFFDVVIRVPPDQLKKVEVGRTGISHGDGHIVQVLDKRSGRLTNVNSLYVGEFSYLRAFTKSSITPLLDQSSVSGEMNVHSNVPVSIESKHQSEIDVETPSVRLLYVDYGSTLTVTGDVNIGDSFTYFGDSEVHDT